MNRNDMHKPTFVYRVPHSRGDEPFMDTLIAFFTERSPQPWG